MCGLTICLTGGIASGKTFVSDSLARHGVAIIDADVIAREVVAVGQPALKELKIRFGSIVINADESLNRAELKRIAFNNKQNTLDLNGILHPIIGAEIKRQLSSVTENIKLVVIPLFNVSMVSMYNIDRVLLVDVAEQIQLKRVMSRDSIEQTLATKIMSSQSSRVAKLNIANDVVVNNRTFGHLSRQVDLLFKYYVRLSGGKFTNCC